MKLSKLIIIPLLLLAADLRAQDIEIYVSDAGNFNSPPWQILKFDKNGENPQVFINQHLGWPQDIVFLDVANTVLISNLSTGRITRYDAETGAYIDDFAAVPGGPTRMKIGADKLLYVLQWGGNGRVIRYQLDGTYLGEFTSVGVSQSIGLDWDGDGNLYVSSYNNDFVRKFDGDGNDLGIFINANLTGPTNIMFNGDGDMLVLDYDGAKVRRFDSNGNYIDDFFGGVGKVEGIDVFANGNILVGVGGSSSVRMFDSGGNFVEEFISSGAGNLIAPNAIVIRNDKPFEINAGLNDAWYYKPTDGQGFFITVFPALGYVSLAWFTYDTELPPDGASANLGDPGHRWLTAIGPIDGNQIEMNVTLTSGGIFDTPTEIQRTEPPGADGTLTVTFDGCNSGTIEYDITSINQQGTIPIERVATDNVALCESLNMGSE